MGAIGWMFVGAIVLAGIALSAGRQDPDEARIVLWGDSLAWEARDSFVAAAQADGSSKTLTRTWGGTAPCDWLDDMRKQARRWDPTVAVLSFSGNTGSDCMRDRDLLTAYRTDVTEAVEILTRRGVEVVLTDSPPRKDQPVGADGLTELDRLWRDIASMRTDVRVAPAGEILTIKGQFMPRLACEAGEACEKDGQVPVRSPDGVHFCPIIMPPMTPCPTRSFGAERFGRALAEAARPEDTSAA
ncbi:hypothetical protein [Parafrankia sp. EUN1f]|uniref:SGNH/GDSL hydrolase family protein n=1 Tax=Parafrankia sp. EUN1f TaxID=102897 RepID=UPI0001C46499|nr:hypothetical protein [Parafrankia sp. EUN1f]EFC80750.1 hypothetical protein FrEUN1fDRAFT_6124 [Parafrankia sp. EUN1f]